MHNLGTRARRPVAAAALLVILVTGAASCKRRKRVVRTVEEAPTLASVVATADPQVSRQLVNGFYGVEQNSWRWTTGRFSVVLRPPPSASTKGATLQLKLAIPDVTIAKNKAVSLSAYVNGTALDPEKYTKAGQFVFSRDVPANLLSSDTARVDFSVDKTLPPTQADNRELGVVVSMIGLQAK